MNKATFLSQLDELFELDEGTVTASAVLQEIDGWSSLTFMGLIALLDQEYGVMLNPDAILGCRTVDDLAELVQEAASENKLAA